MIAGTALYFGAVLALRFAVPRSAGWPLVDLLIGGSFIAVLGLTTFALLLRGRWRRPATFTVRPNGTFVVPVSADQVLGVVGQLGVFFLIFSSLSVLEPADPQALGIIMLSMFGAGCLLSLAEIVRIWRGTGLELRPDGLVEYVAFGTLRMPWEALLPGQPQRPRVGAEFLAIAYQRPDLVRSRGIGRLKRNSLSIGHVQPSFLADAIRFYATYPAERAGIGTPEGYHRLLHALGAAPTSTAGPGTGIPRDR